MRRAYAYRCGYCGVREEEIGSELELDHFQPRAAGGGDELNNLVYCCSVCNRIKSDFWSDDQTGRLLHPGLEAVSLHLREEFDGRLTPLTERGAFHLQRLRLNRPQLVRARRRRSEDRHIQQELAEVRENYRRALQHMRELEQQLQQALDQLDRQSES